MGEDKVFLGAQGNASAVWVSGQRPNSRLMTRLDVCVPTDSGAWLSGLDGCFMLLRLWNPR